MSDRVMEGFLRRQHEDAIALARDSDVVGITPIGGDAADRFLVRLTCRGLVRTSDSSIVEAHEFAIGIWFPANHLRLAEPRSVVTWIAPRQVWHPNIAGDAALICIGHVAPGIGLVDLIYQCWEIVTWNRVTMREDDALNQAACQWARHNLSRLPVDTRPLRRQALPVATALSVGGTDVRA